MRKENKIDMIPKEKFSFVQMDAQLHDQKLETKARSFFADAMLRFSKNKSSVIAAWILLFLVVFAILSPILSPYDVMNSAHNDTYFRNYPSYIPSIAKLNLGIMDGSKVHSSQNDAAVNYWKGIAVETGLDPVLGVEGTHEVEVIYRGQTVIRTTYDLNVNRYYETGIINKNLSNEELQDLMDWQDKTGIQVIYPYVESKDINDITDNPNIWYAVDKNGAAKLDKDGNFVAKYSTNKEMEAVPYNSLRIEGDDGSYIYSYKKGSSNHVRLCYYNYYQYLYGFEPQYLLGTNSLGQDIFCAIGAGARFSLIFAILVSAINLTIGAIYGAIQGYYGGRIDMTMDRITDILSGVPFVVVITLFNLHLSQKTGPLVAFLMAFVLTGWISMASLTRKQFYRYKNQEFVMAARTLGASDWRLMFKHVFPNAIGTIITSCALVIPSVISSETSISYLGIMDLTAVAGTTLGTLLSKANDAVTSAPHAMLWPSVYLGLMMISFNLFGNGLRDAFNPSTRGVED